MKEKLNEKKLGLAIGIVWAAGVLLLALMAMLWDWGTGVISLLGSLYLGYDASLLGMLAGAIWAFVDGFVCGFLIAWIYNRI